MDKRDTLLRLKEKDREFRRRLIIDAAREVLGEKTYDSMSMAEIARSAGIAKSSIYTYFKSQEDLYVEIAREDFQTFINGLENKIKDRNTDILKTAINYFLDYYILNESQWRMITRFALHGNKEKKSIEKLNLLGRRAMDLLDGIFEKLGKRTDIRLLSHALFSSLSGILIAYRKYPGRTKEERVAHMKHVGSMLEAMITALIEKETTPFP
jgi:AcrR family transcriptional regulator